MRHALRRSSWWGMALCAVLGLAARDGVAAEPGYGRIEGQFLFDGEIPKPELLVPKGDKDVRDSEVCAAEVHYSEVLIVDPATRGIANIFVYPKARPEPIHPSLRQSAKKEIDFDQKACRFIPHAMIVRTDQTVRAKSADPVAHNVHPHPLVNNPPDFVVSPDDRKGVPFTFPRRERLPVKVTCDIHPHMTAYWLVVDHPYAALTGTDGTFTIENVPAGEYEFLAWHELTGYATPGGSKGALKVKVEAGQTTRLAPAKVPAAKFQP